MTLNDFAYIIPDETEIEVYVSKGGYMKNDKEGGSYFRMFGYANGIFERNNLADIINRRKNVAKAQIFKMEVKEKRLRVYYLWDELYDERGVPHH